MVKFNCDLEVIFQSCFPLEGHLKEHLPLKTYLSLAKNAEAAFHSQ